LRFLRSANILKNKILGGLNGYRGVRLYALVTSALRVNKLWIEVYARVPFNRVEGYLGSSEGIVIFQPLKDTEIQKSPHVQGAALSIVEND
jgi:hypothetical protein